MERSYTSITKDELCKLRFTKDQHLLAELSAFSFSSGNIKLGRGNLVLELSSENENVIVRMGSIIKRLYKNFPEIRAVEKTQPKKHTVYKMDITPNSPEGQMLFEIGLLEGVCEDYSFGEINKKVFEPEGCFEASLRGAFLGSGVLCDPEKSYRLEFVLSHDEFAQYLLNTLIEKGMNAKFTTRKERKIIYFKQIEFVADVLIMSGATNVMMQLESVSVNKAVKNQMNRTGNCIVANIQKTVNASQRQIEDINALMNAGVKLTKPLKEACDLRLNNPDTSLSDLSKISGISKSALNKRYIKIRKLREEL